MDVDVGGTLFIRVGVVSVTIVDLIVFTSFNLQAINEICSVWICCWGVIEEDLLRLITFDEEEERRWLLLLDEFVVEDECLDGEEGAVEEDEDDDDDDEDALRLCLLDSTSFDLFFFWISI